MSVHHPPPAFEAGPQRLVPFNQRWHVAKMVLRGISLTLAAVLLGLSIASAIPEFHERRPRAWRFALPAAIVAGTWDVAEFATLWIRRRRASRGIHPGAHVGVELVLWMLCAAMATYIAVMSPFQEVSIDYGHVVVYYPGSPTPEVDVACSVVAYLLFIPHFVLFCRACRETRQRNRSRSPRMMYIPGGGRPFCVEEAPVAYHGLQTPAPAHVEHHSVEANLETNSEEQDYDELIKEEKGVVY